MDDCNIAYYCILKLSINIFNFVTVDILDSIVVSIPACQQMPERGRPGFNSPSGRFLFFFISDVMIKQCIKQIFSLFKKFLDNVFL